MIVSPICEKYKNSILNWIDPKAGPGKSVVTEALRRHLQTGGRPFGRCQLKRERAIFVHAFGEVSSEKFAGFGSQDLCVTGQKLLAYPEHLTRGRKQSGVSGSAAHEISIT